MNKLKRVLSGTLALALAGSILTACGDDSSSDSKSGGDSSTGSSTGGDSGSSGKKTVLKVSTFTEETEPMLKTFLEKNPDFAAKYEFKIDLTATASDYISKIEATLADGKDVPDLFLADADYSQKFAGNAGTATIEELGIKVNAADYYAYTLEFVTIDNKLMGLSHQAAPGAVFYRTDYAKEYLGIETPEAMQEAVSTWDKFIETAKKLEEKAGDKVFMISGIDELKRVFMANRATAWVVDGNKFSVDEAVLKKYFETTKTLFDAKAVKSGEKETQWQTPWFEGMQDGVFCYFGCTWYLHYTIKPNCLKTKTGAKDKDGKDTVVDADYKVGNGSYGKWGMISGPQGFFWGGTWWFGAKNSSHKDAVKTIIEWFCVNDESMAAYSKSKGDFPSKKTVVNAIKDDPVFNNVFLGGQNHFKMFAEAAEKVTARTMTKYDDTFNTALGDATLEYVLNGKSYEDCLKQIKNDAKTKISDLKFD